LNNVIIFHIDMRLENLFLMSSPIPTFLITFAYLAFVYYGPKWMKNREPFELKGVIKVYNLSLSVISGYLFYEVNKFYFLNPVKNFN
jgi:hypothetical protein